MRLGILSIASLAIVFAPSAGQAADVFGNIYLNVTGTFRTPVTQGGNASCSASALIVPDTKGGVTLSSISAALTLNSGIQTKTGAGVVSSDRSTFTCRITLPYSFANFINGQQIAVFYTVEGFDGGYYDPNTERFVPGTRPLSVRQLLTIPSMPANGATTRENVSVTL